ncbi:M1 family metallopeptidase [Agreia sp. VKM Ac-1783]|uniref:M1 family metallopeptidase n=1 Tax=Agreia sp. VKM Ac-1783 TaxID=1938889 RepID=UPI000A2ABFB5|nr:M1 family metallopeptidase [Agreia sp. VKM Ac-1783]SMQ59052.1 LPXTG-motif cell wall anchor domain-containing protein [Agreia sp. VKM Ac-1783]
MTPCVLAATGFDSGPLLLVIAIVLLAAGSAAWLLLGRRKRGASTAVFAAVPLLVLALVASGGVSATPASAAEPCPPPVSSPVTSPAPSDPATPIDFQPGAAGIGDSYFPLDGNGGYDVQHYDLDLTYAPDTDVISGTTTVTAVATQNLSAFNLDFDTRDVNGDNAITISSITVDGKAATWSLASTQISKVTGQPQAEGSTDDDATPPRTELTVVPPAGIPLGSTITTAVTYSGVPIVVDDAYGPAGVFPTPTGAVVVGQPRVAATWFPSNDHPSDKATFSTHMTVPDGLEVIGNGRLAGRETSGETETFDWEMEKPMATYLATATVGDFAVDTRTVDGITYVDAIDRSLLTRDVRNAPGVKVGDIASQIFETEPEVINFLSGSFGPYPFSEAGGIAIGYIDEGDPTAVPPVRPSDLPYALENQTRPIYPAWAFPADVDASVVVHELAHQWYGDNLSMNRWSDIWLNEGFATYAEWLWEEHQGGRTTQEIFNDAYTHDYAADDDPDFWQTVVADPGAAGIFNSGVYTRGAMTLQALRTEVGDDAFFAILKGWATENAGTSVSTAQFVDYAESVSGRDLTEFFNTWIYTPGQPPLG